MANDSVDLGDGASAEFTDDLMIKITVDIGASFRQLELDAPQVCKLFEWLKANGVSIKT